MIVVKVGGSLFDSPRLGPALRAYLDALAPADVLLVPGGGPVADAVRELDRTHGLGEEAAHWLALRSLGVTKELLLSFTSPPEGEVAGALPAGGGEGDAARKKAARASRLFRARIAPPHPARRLADLPLRGGGEDARSRLLRVRP